MAVTVPTAATAQDAGLFMSACDGGSEALGIAEFDGLSVTSG